MNQTKIQKTYVDYGFGFPVKLLNAPLKKIQKEWVLDLNFEKYEKAILLAVALKSSRLSGNEIRFIRHSFEMDLKAFGKRFGDVAHSAVIKWEKCGDLPTQMNWATEKDMRLAIVDKIKPKIFRKVYGEFKDVLPRKAQRLQLEAEELKAA